MLSTWVAAPVSGFMKANQSLGSIVGASRYSRSAKRTSLLRNVSSTEVRNEGAPSKVEPPSSAV